MTPTYFHMWNKCPDEYSEHLPSIFIAHPIIVSYFNKNNILIKYIKL